MTSSSPPSSSGITASAWGTWRRGAASGGGRNDPIRSMARVSVASLEGGAHTAMESERSLTRVLARTERSRSQDPLMRPP